MTTRDHQLQIEVRPIDQLKPDPRNPRRHSRKQIKQLARSIETFGFIAPALVDGEGQVIAGHGRILACRELGWSAIPTIRIDGLSEAKRRALMIADNRLAENASWDERLLEDPADTVPEPVSSAPVSRMGSLWLLGGHRVLCGSVLDMTAVERLMAEERAAMVFTDPPYNVPIDGHATGLGKIHHRPFAMATGEMSSPAFAAFLARSLRNQAAAKDNGGMGSLYRSQHELVFVFKTGGGSHRNNVQLGRFGRNRSNVWHYPGVNSFGRKTNEGNLLEMHPTVKPVALVADAILDCTARGDIVLDGFLGSGTTVMAAERIGRRCFGTEIDPVYVDTIVRRWQSLTGGTARDAATGAAFDDLVRGAEVADAA